jgi:hypothetical protein
MLRFNSTLEILTLGSNGMGLEGSLALTEALKENTTLLRIECVCSWVGWMGDGGGELGVGGACPRRCTVLPRQRVPAPQCSRYSFEANDIGSKGGAAWVDLLRTNVTLIQGLCVLVRFMSPDGLI